MENYPEFPENLIKTQSKARPVIPSVFDYHDFRTFIEDAQRAIKAVRPVFTYRYIAQKVGMKSPGHITWIIQGKRNLSKKKLLPFAQVLGLGAKETAFFVELVHFNQARTHIEKKLHLDRLVGLQSPEKAIIPPQSYALYDKWYHSVVRELFAIYSLDDDYKQIAKLVSPPITPREAQQSVELLLKLGLIGKDASGRYVQVKQAISTGDVWRSVAIRQFQIDTFDLAKEALNSVDAKERDISTLTMSISPERFTAMVERIKQFRSELISLVTSDEKPSRVYQFSMALFPLSRKEREQ